MSNQPLCAVWVVTYNQKKFIAQTIESIINQKTDFHFKVFIGDDLSTDGTREICIKYKNDYPELIELIFNSSNWMNKNSANVYHACFTSGAKYTAMCEGDDYWIDPNKLQKQVKFLETHPEYVGCFHNTEERYEDDEDKASFLYCDYPSAKSISFHDLSFRNLIPTCSVVFRNKLFGEFPEWYPQLKMGDWTLHLLNAQFGSFWYIPKVMAVHRLHTTSHWMLQDANRNNQFVIEAYDALIKGFSHNKIFEEQLIKARAAFINSIQIEIHRTGYKRRIKNLLIRIIEKL
jgi:glycosyltransferase involved in cell wall biosynthesis